jgi:chaperonin GroES
MEETATSTIRKLDPAGHRVLIKLDAAEEKTAGGLYIPDSNKEKPLRGTVIAAGPGKRLDSGDRLPMTVKEGDRVFIPKYSGVDIELNGDELRLLYEDDVLGFIREEGSSEV